jgi:hypothetical protein
MACHGCEAQQISDNEQLKTAINKAAEYAKEKNEAVGIYKDEQGQYQFIRLAIAAGYPITQIISQYSPTPVG